MSHIPFSVLLSVYRAERPERLYHALGSIWEGQTVRPTEIVLVEDGPLTPELYTVIDHFQRSAPLTVIALDIRQGLGQALNAGLQHCTCELVARMDSDDVSKPQRFAKQTEFMAKHPDIAVCGTWTDEFIGSTDRVVSQRRLPETSKELAAFARKRCPLNHPTVMFRKNVVEAVGGYEHFPLFEDYWLWSRMLTNGYCLYNLQEPLLWFRTSEDLYKRRGGWRYGTTELHFQYKLWRIGCVSFSDMLVNGTIRFIIRVLPNSVRKILYEKTVRT